MAEVSSPALWSLLLSGGNDEGGHRGGKWREIRLVCGEKMRSRQIRSMSAPSRGAGLLLPSPAPQTRKPAVLVPARTNTSTLSISPATLRGRVSSVRYNRLPLRPRTPRSGSLARVSNMQNVRRAPVVASFMRRVSVPRFPPHHDFRQGTGSDR